MSAAHIQIARGEREFNGRTGPKAAFEFYLSQNVHTARARQAAIRGAGNAKKQFAAYCGEFGSQFGTVNGNGAVRSNEQVEEVQADLLAALQGDPQAALNKLAEILGRKAPVVQNRREVGVKVFDQEDEDNEVPSVDISTAVSGLLAKLTPTAPAPVVVEAAPKAARVIPVATRISFKMAMAVKKVCTKQGLLFEITGKTGGEGTDSPADYTVTVNGVALSPAEASAVIAASKS